VAVSIPDTLRESMWIMAIPAATSSVAFVDYKKKKYLLKE